MSQPAEQRAGKPAMLKDKDFQWEDPLDLEGELSEEERRVYDAIRESETSIDDIATKADLPSGSVSSALLRLELKRLVKQLPGKYFVKLG